MNKQKFIDKFMAAFVLLAMFKVIGIVAQLFHESFWSVIGTLAIFLIVAFIILMVIASLKDKEQNKQNSRRGRAGGGNFYLENSCLTGSGANTKILPKNILKKKITKKQQKFI